MAYGGQERLLQIAFTLRSALATVCRRNSLFKLGSPVSIYKALEDDAAARAWELFLEQEEQKRVAFFTFVRSSQRAVGPFNDIYALDPRLPICTLL
jgi:hypothetical protein